MDIVLQSCYAAFTGLFRVFPLPYNFSPIYSYSSYIFVNNKKSYIAVIIMIVMLLLTDVLLYLKDNINTIPGWFWLYSHPIHILNGYIARYIIKENDQIVNIGVTFTLTSFNFFMLSNFGVFLFNTTELSVANLSKTYIDAIPFFPLSIISNILFSIVFFGIDVVIRKLMAKRNDVKVDGLLSLETLDVNPFYIIMSSKKEKGGKNTPDVKANVNNPSFAKEDDKKKAGKDKDLGTKGLTTQPEKNKKGQKLDKQKL